MSRTPQNELTSQGLSTEGLDSVKEAPLLPSESCSTVGKSGNLHQSHPSNTILWTQNHCPSCFCANQVITGSATFLLNT